MPRMNIEELLESKAAARHRREAKALERLRAEDDLIEAMFIGKLCRDGATVRYINLRPLSRGQIKTGEVWELIDYCRRNKWLNR